MNRFYSPQQGRFTQVDPIGMDAVNFDDPQTFNMYAYCRNDPINHVDPEGLFFGFFKKIFGGIKKFFSSVIGKIAVAVALIVLTAGLLGPLAAQSVVGGFSIGGGATAAVVGATHLTLLGWATVGLAAVSGVSLPSGFGRYGGFRTPSTFPSGTGVGSINNFQGAKKSSAKPNIAPIIFVGAIETINIVDKAPDNAPDKAPSTFSDCFNKYKFTSSVGALFGPTAESIAEVFSVTSYVSFAGDMVATVAKASGKTLGRPQPYASGLNWVFRRISRGAVRGTLTTIGGAVSNSLAVTAVFTGTYDLSIAAQCASGILK